jgi:hypothetical protein
MVLGDLSVDFSKAALPDKTKVEELLAGLLPTGSYMVLVRNYQAGDFRSNDQDTHHASTLLISLRRTGREAALEKRAELEAFGFRVAQDGSLSLN